MSALLQLFIERGCTRDGDDMRCACGNVVSEGEATTTGLVAYATPIPGLSTLHRFDFACRECGKVLWDAVQHYAPARVGWIAPSPKLMRWLKEAREAEGWV